MTRITADGVIDRDELLELHLAIERVIPSENRVPIIQARKIREKERRDRLREKRRIEKEKEMEERRLLREEERTRAMRLRHSFANIAGVTFPNEDGSERQAIIRECKPGELLVLEHDAYNRYSIFATKVLRMNGQQLGHVPEYLAERIIDEMEQGYVAVGVLKEITGGTWDKPTRGVNFVVFFLAKGVPNDEFRQYANKVLSTHP